MSVQEAWTTLSDLGKKLSQKPKLDTLIKFIIDPSGDAWQQQLCTSTESITQKHTMQKSATKYYRGELERIHGIEEANAFIAKGKYRETTDGQGDTCYVKVRESEIIGKERTATVSASRHSAGERGG